MLVASQPAGSIGRVVRTAFAGLLLVLPAAVATAQTAAQATTARALIHNLVAQRTHPPEASLTPDEVAAIARRGDQLANEIGDGIAVAVATAPIGGLAAGFSYGVDPTTGELTLRTASFGPILMDFLPLTNGAGVFGFGVSYQRLLFRSLPGAGSPHAGHAALRQPRDLGQRRLPAVPSRSTWPSSRPSTP